MTNPGLSKDFFDLVKSIGESRSKQEEDKIILREIGVLKQKMGEKDVLPKKMKEFLIRMIYCEMLGHDASFGHIHAVKMVQTKKLLDKRVAYLAVSLCLHSGHTFIMLLINSLQQDLRSENFLEVSMSLTVVCKLVNAETIPALLPLVLGALEHKQASVRKKAVMALHRFHQIDDESVGGVNELIRKVLCDKDPSVMGASLCLLLDLARQKPSAYKDLIPSFVSILKQVTEHRLPRDYDYHRMPAPWIQLNLLRILAVLGANDKGASEGMYEILHEVMKRADIGINVGYAIVYECVRTVTTIYPDSALIEDAATHISRFVGSDNHNLKYLGVNALASIVQINPKYAVEHQLTVIDCLEDPDDTLKRKTLDLLYSMTNPANVVVIVDKLVAYLSQTQDSYLKSDLITRITRLAEKFAPSHAWYIETMNNIFELAGDLVRPEMAHALMRLLAENSADGVKADGETDIRTYAVETYHRLLADKPVLPDILVQVSVWVLGEFANWSQSASREQLAQRLCASLEKAYTDDNTKSWIMHALMKVVAPLGAMPQDVKELVARYQSSLFVDLQQRAHEFFELAKTPRTMAAVLAPEADAPVDMDDDLSFLDAYVRTALDNGAKPYNPPKAEDSRTDDSGIKALSGGLRFAPYAAPVDTSTDVSWDTKPDTPKTSDPVSDLHIPGLGASLPAPAGPVSSTGLSGLSRVARKWGPEGYNDADSAAAAAAAAEKEKAEREQKEQREREQKEKERLAAIGAPGGPHGQHMQEPASIASSPAVPRSTVKPLDPEVLAKQQRAQALFAGFGSPAATPALTGGRAVPSASPVRPITTATASPAAAPTPAPAPKPVASVFDILGGAIMGGSTPSAPAPAPAVSHVGGLDFLADAFGSGSGSGAAAIPSPRASTGGLSGLDLDLSGMSFLDGPALSPSAGAGAGAGPGLNQSSVSGLDGFGGLLGGLEPQVAAVKLGSEGMSSTMRVRLGALTKSQQPEQVLAQDDRLYISSYKVFATDRTIAVLFVTNTSAGVVSNVTIQLGLHPGFAATFDGEPAVQVRAGPANSFTLVIPSVQATATAVLLVSLQVRDPSAVQASSISGQASVPSALAMSGLAAATSPLSFALPVTVTDLLRPAQLTTPQYGGLWKQTGNAASTQIRGSSCRTCAEFMDRMKTALGIFPVETIREENIVAGKLVSGGAFMCFMHGRLLPGNSWDVTVRSSSSELSQALINAASLVLK